MKAGSLEKPEQFVVVDDNTFRVDFIKKDRLTIPDIAVIVPGIYNSGAAASRRRPRRIPGRSNTPRATRRAPAPTR